MTYAVIMPLDVINGLLSDIDTDSIPDISLEPTGTAISLAIGMGLLILGVYRKMARPGNNNDKTIDLVARRTEPVMYKNAHYMTYDLYDTTDPLAKKLHNMFVGFLPPYPGGTTMVQTENNLPVRGIHKDPNTDNTLSEGSEGNLMITYTPSTKESRVGVWIPVAPHIVDTILNSTEWSVTSRGLPVLIMKAMTNGEEKTYVFVCLVG